MYVEAGYKILPSISRILISLQQLEYNVQGIDSIAKNYKEIDRIRKKDQLKDKSEIITDLKFNKNIEIKNVSFKYSSSKDVDYVLRHIHLIIE